MPDSFQRPGRKECDAEGSLKHRVSLRTQEVEYALARIRELSWVDQQRVILMGFSEGGNTTDNWSRKGFAAHIVIGSACALVGGAPAAPEGVPVLAIVGSKDEFRPGLSCKIERTIRGSKSIVIPGAGHSIAGYGKTRNAIRTFLSQCCSPQAVTQRVENPPAGR
jgi:dienelactone hydrolase